MAESQRLIGGGLVLAVALSACTAPSMTVDEYSDALDAATGSYITESQALSVAFQRSVEDQIGELSDSGEGDLMALATDVTSRAMTQYLVLLEDAMARYQDVLEEMHPPEALTEFHDGYVASIESIRIALPPTRVSVGEADDLDGIQEAVTSSGFADGQLRLQSSCLALEEAVRAEGRGVELGCLRPVTGG